MKKSIATNAILNMLQTILSIIFPLITFPYCSRILGVEGIGKYGFSSSIISYFILLSGLGVKTYAIREGARIRDDRKKISKFISDIYSINIISMILSYIVLVFIIIIFQRIRSYKVLITILSLQIFFITIGKEYLFIIYENYLYITIRQLLFQFISLLAMFIFVKDKSDLQLYCFISILGVILSNIVNYFDSKKYADVKFTFCPDFSHLKYILLIFSTTIGIVIYASSDITILGIYGEDYNVGLYNTSVKIYSTVKQGVAAILTVSIPRFSFYLGKKEISKFSKLFDDLFNSLLYIMLPTIVGLIMLSKEIVLIVSGENFINSITSLRILSIAMLFNLISYMYGYCILIPNRKDRGFMLVTMVGAIANVTLNLIFIPSFLENAAAATTVFSEFIVFVITIILCKDIYLSTIKCKDLISIIIGCLFISIICYFMKKIFINYIIIIFSSTILSVCLYIIVTYLLGNTTIKNINMYVKSKIIEFRLSR